MTKPDNDTFVFEEDEDRFGVPLPDDIEIPPCPLAGSMGIHTVDGLTGCCRFCGERLEDR